MAKAPQLAAVVIALMLVLGGVGYGIVRSFQSGTDYSRTACRSRTAEWIPIAGTLSVPTELPDGVDLEYACYSTGIVTLVYRNEQKDKFMIVTALQISRVGRSEPTGREIRLGDVVGQESDDGTFHSIEFEKHGWLYGVSTKLGKNGMLPDNKVTPEDLYAAALSMAQQ